MVDVAFRFDGRQEQDEPQKNDQYGYGGFDRDHNVTSYWLMTPLRGPAVCRDGFSVQHTIIR